MKPLIFFLVFMMALISMHGQDITSATNHPKSNPAVAVNTSDSLALVALFQNTDGNNWTIKDGWLQDSVYKWYGITINSNGRVTEINLNDNNLSGKLPNQIANLSALTSLDLSNNNLKFELTVDFSQMINLEYLHLEHNNFTGNIPSSLGDAPALKEIYLSYNQFTGSLSIDNNFQTLEIGDFSHNMLTTVIMDGDPENPNLYQVHLDYNCITDFQLTNAAGFSYIGELYINNNKLTTLPNLADFYNNGLYTLHVENNYLDFGDLENGNVQTENSDFVHNIYFPQFKVGDVEYYNPTAGSNLTLSVSVAGNNNSYVWYRNGNSTNTYGSNFNINDYDSLFDAGTYYCKITNSDFSDLTLYSNNKLVDVDTPFYDVNITPEPSQAAEFFIGNGSYYEGQEAVLKVKTNPTWHFLGWKINNEFIGADTILTFTVLSDINATASFTKDSTYYTATVEVVPSEGGTVSGGGHYHYGDIAHISITPAPNCTFQQWNEYDNNGQIISTRTEQSFDITITHDVIWKAQVECTSTQINEPKKSQIQIYPNPATNFVNITSIETDITQIQLINMLGQPLSIKMNKTNKRQFQINLSNIPAGTYIMKIKTDYGNINKLIIIK